MSGCGVAKNCNVLGQDLLMEFVICSTQESSPVGTAQEDATAGFKFDCL